MDALVSLAYQMTSYVSEAHSPRGRIFLCRSQEPRDSLDRLMQAWIWIDPPALEATLGPAAKAALEAAGADVQSPDPGSRGPAGYWLDIPGAWSQPLAELVESQVDSRDVVNAIDGHFEIEMRLKDRAGNDCGRDCMRFLLHDGESHLLGPDKPLSYLVDNADLLDLLRTVSQCSALVTTP